MDSLDVAVSVPYGTEPDDVGDVLANYPRLADGERAGATHDVFGGFEGVVLRWETRVDETHMPSPSFFDLVSTRVDGDARRVFGQGWAVPAVTPGVAPPPIVSWWLLLFMLSNLARYHPALWRSAIDPSSSQLAVPLERAMDLALECLPTRVLDELRAIPGRR